MTVWRHKVPKAAVDEAVQLGLLVRERRLCGGAVDSFVKVTDLGKRMWLLLEAYRELPEEDSERLQ